MLEISKKEECCGCEVCTNVCPKNCIKMTADEKGFFYPKIDKKNCIECGLCEQVCPVANPVKRSGSPVLYAMQNRDDKVREESTSGGTFTAIAQWVLNQGGIVIGAAYDEQFRVIHKAAETEEEIGAFRGSKYVQSRTGQIYREVKKYLESGRWVCFSGTPCQINGLKRYLRKDYETLVAVDIVCHGITSPLFYKKYLDHHRKTAGSNIKNVQFREKYYGYGFSTMKIGFQDGTCYRAGMESDIFLKSFFADLNTREACHACRFKTVERVSDFTLFDGWHAKQYDVKMDDDKGTTLCMVQSDKGRKILGEIAEKMRMTEVPLEQGVKLDGSMVLKSTVPNRQRETFFKDMHVLSIPEMQQKYYPITWKRKILCTIKPIAYKTGIFKLYMKRKERKAKR